MVLKSCHNTKTIYQLENKKRHHHTKICEMYKTSLPAKQNEKKIISNIALTVLI